MSSDAVKRILLVGDSNDPKVTKQIETCWHGGADQATLVVRGITELEHKARRWWQNMGSTVAAPAKDGIDGLKAEAEEADYVIACTTRYGDEACQVMWHLDRLAAAWPPYSLVRPTTMGYPFPPGHSPHRRRR